MNLNKPLIYLITPGDADDANFAVASEQILATVRLAAAEKISLVQIREKKLSARNLYDLVKRASAITTSTSTKLLVNDRADIAMAAAADGVHLAGDSLRADVVRAHSPNGFIVGVSTHTVDETVEARRRGADFAVFAPVFETPGKRARGLGELRSVCDAVSGFPVIALGGIDPANCTAAIDAGAAGVAAIRSLNDAAAMHAISSKLKA